MYGMNQNYTAPDPSAQVPNHLVSRPMEAPQELLFHDIVQH